MQILIVGDGKVGYTLAEQLSKEDHDVTVVDNNTDALNKALETLDVMCIKGSASSIQTLKDAGVEDADIVIAVTSRDEVNMICALFAHNLGAKHIIARIRNPEYSASNEMLAQTLGINMVVNPELACAQEISRLLRFPSASSIEAFARGRVELVGFSLGEQSPIVGKSVAQVGQESTLPFLFGAVERGDDVVIPDGTFVFRENDFVYVIGEPPTLMAFARFLGYVHVKIKKAMIVGGSRIAFYLANSLQRSLGRFGTVKLIENDEERSDELSKMLPDTMVIHGDGTDQELLESENLQEMDAFVSLMDLDEKNIIGSLYAIQMGVKKVVCKVSRSNYSHVFNTLKVGSAVNPKELAANQIVRYVRACANSKGSFVEQLYKILDGKAEAVEFAAAKSSHIIGVKLKDLHLNTRGVIIAAIIRKNKVIIPRGEQMILEGDGVIVICKDKVFTDLNEILN